MSTVSVNGRLYEAMVDERMPLVHFVRDVAKLKGTRYGCGEEQCGACVVLIDGKPKASCQVETGHMRGKAVVTVEGVAKTAIGKRLLYAFIARQAGQCGFCLSGILVRAAALVEDEAFGGGREAIATALAPHLCRCGAHPRILAAVADVLAERRPS